MRSLIAFLTVMTSAAPAFADAPYWQCAAFARQFSGIALRGDAWTWWRLAEGRYARGDRPQIGAVMAFTPSARMRLGHVATVTQILDRREITVTHANWSPIDGVRGQIEHDVRVVDVSLENDWSQVRVWFAPLDDLGTTAWPVTGFIYPLALPVLPRRVAGRVALHASGPRLAYARLELLRIDPAAIRYRIGRDVIQLAMLEDRRR